MSLLQNPIKALDQIDWYLANQEVENFPGAFLLAAGNLSRQVLEQVLFILAFYSGMPTSKYMKPSMRLKMAGEVTSALRQVNPTSGRTYIEEARRRSPRIRKFARYWRSFDKWRDEFNEPSHFRNPAARRITREGNVKDFSRRLRALFDPVDAYLITAAVNELLSRGKIRAIIADDEKSTPGAAVDLVVDVKNVGRDENGGLALLSPKLPVRVIPDTEEVPLCRSRAVILVQHSTGMMLQGHFVTPTGEPVDLSSLQTMLQSFMKTESGRDRLRRRLRKLGYTIEWTDTSQTT